MGIPGADWRGRVTRRVRMVAWLVAGCGISLALLWLAARGVDFGAVRDSLAESSIPLAALACLTLLCVYVLNAIRWAGLADSVGRPPLRRMFELVLIGMAVNNTLPGRLGEVARAYGLSRSNGAHTLTSLGTVIVDRLADVILLAGLLGVSVIFAPAPDWVVWIGLAVGVGTLVAAGALIALARTRDRRRDADEHTGVRRHLATLANGVDCLTGWPVVARTLVASIAAWGLWMLGAWLTARSLGVGLSLAEVGLATAVINLGVAIPSSPGFVGTYQWLGVSVLVLFDVARPEAFAFSVLLHALWFVPTTIAGIALMARYGLRPGMLRRLRMEADAVPS